MVDRWGKMETVVDFIFLDFKITVDDDCSHEIKRHLLLGRKALTNLDSALKSRDITGNKGLYSQSYGLSSSHVLMLQFSSVQLLSHVQLFATPWTAARQASLSITNSRSSLRLKSIESVMPSSHPVLCSS